MKVSIPPIYYEATMTEDAPRDPQHPTHPHTIATTILNQISWSDPWALGAWGVRHRIPLQPHHQRGSYYYGGLLIRVSGFKLRGWVCIKLRGDDLYMVSFWRRVGRMWNEYETLEGIYCDQLEELIDGRVEGTR